MGTPPPFTPPPNGTAIKALTQRLGQWAMPSALSILISLCGYAVYQHDTAARERAAQDLRLSAMEVRMSAAEGAIQRAIVLAELVASVRARQETVVQTQERILNRLERLEGRR